jgi:hypothetical protein
MRNGMTGDRVALNKAIPQNTVNCRRCNSGVETLAHTVGQCTTTKSQRIKRQDEIREFISKKLVEGEKIVQVIEEAAVQTPSGTFKPDLAVISQGRVNVIDVTVRHEDKWYLEEGYTSKMAKYKPLLPVLAEKLQVSPGIILAVVIGTRGAISKSTNESLEHLGITDRGSLITTCLMAVRSSIEFYQSFLEYNVPIR